MMPSFTENRGVKFSVEETSPSLGVVQTWNVNEDEDQNLITICNIYLDRFLGAVLRSLTGVVSCCRVFSCCGWHEAVKLSVEETSPSRVSVQPWGVVEGDTPCHHIPYPIRPVPVYPWADTQISDVFTP